MNSLNNSKSARNKRLRRVSAVKRILPALLAAVLVIGVCACARTGPDGGNMGEKATKFKSVKVAGNDISAFTVVCDASSGSTAERAAADLVKYIKQTAGVELPLQVCDGSVPEALSGKDSRVICVGKTPFDTEKSLAAVKDLKNNGYAIVADGGNLFLTGATPTGAMYAVYSFLEDIVGWRFYSSTFELLKDRSPLDVPEGFTKTFSPKLFSRDTFWFDTFDETFAAKLKLNGCVNRDNNNYGEMVRYAGRFVHSLPALAGTSYEPDVQPCLTDPAVYEKVLEGVRSWLRDNPGAKIVSVSQNDSYADGRGCQCENCRKLDEEEGTPMGSLLMLLTGFGWAKPVEVNPSRMRNPRRGMALTALAGPVSNLIAAFAAGLVKACMLCTEDGFRAYRDYLLNDRITTTFCVMLLMEFLMIVNIGLAIFNLIPIPPLDGFNVMRYFTSNKFDRWVYMHYREIQMGFLAFILILNLDLIPHKYNLLYLAQDKVYNWMWDILVKIPEHKWGN